MGKSKQAKEKKFDRNVEISAPILDPEIIKAIHTPPKGQRLDIKHGGFKALLSDLNSQDSTDELMPLNDNHVPSYIGISCAVSGYSNYSSYSKRPGPGEATSHHQQVTTKTNISNVGSHPNRSQTTSPVMHQIEHQVHHITIDKENIHSPDDERKELTEKLTACASEHRRSPSPCIPPTEDDRHHGAYVGARYFPLPPPSKLVNKHIPLLGIDDEQNPDDFVEEEQGVEQKIASLYGDNFVDDWRESMTHKAKKEINEQQEATTEQLKSPKDLVTLKPTRQPVVETTEHQVDIPTPKVKVLAQVEKQFLNKLLSDENPPQPSQSPTIPTATATKTTTTRIETTASKIVSSPESPSKELEQGKRQHHELEEEEEIQFRNQQQQQPQHQQFHQSPPMSPDSGKNQSFADEELVIPSSHTGEEHIEYEIRAQSPVDNESSPVKIRHHQMEEEQQQQKVEEDQQPSQQAAEQKLVSFSPEPPKVAEEELTNQSNALVEEIKIEESSLKSPSSLLELETQEQQQSVSDSNDGSYYLNLMDQEKSFILKQVRLAEEILENQEAELEEDTVGRIRSAIGKANLLINKKFNQFKELCEANINKNSDEQYSTLNDDLAGFWDMLCIQVSDVRKLFEVLWQAKESDWNFDSTSNRQQMSDEHLSVKSSTGNITTKSVKLSAQKDQERRDRLQQHMKQMKQNQAAKSSTENLLGGGEIETDQKQEPSLEEKIVNELGEMSIIDQATKIAEQENLVDLIDSEFQQRSHHQEHASVNDEKLVGEQQSSTQVEGDLVDLIN